MTRITEIQKQLKSLKEDAHKSYRQEEKPGKIAAATGFFHSCGEAIYFILTEKENIVFALLSLITISMGYFIGTQVLDWIPQEIWDSADDEEHTIVSLILLLWFFICVGLVAYPLGILTACMGASYILRFQGRQSTIAECLKIVMPKAWTLWIFSWLDGWWTFMRILERLPKKNDRTPRSTKIYNEMVYQAWKLATLGFIPATVCGRNLGDACKDSLLLIKKRFRDLAILRLGYSIICWIIAIAAYVGVFLTAIYFPDIKFGNNEIYSFYFIAAFPIILSLSIIMLIFRPIYIIAACRIYAFYARENQIDIKLPEKSARALSTLVCFILLLAALLITAVFRDELGISALLAEQ